MTVLILCRWVFVFVFGYDEGNAIEEDEDLRCVHGSYYRRICRVRSLRSQEVTRSPKASRHERSGHGVFGFLKIFQQACRYQQHVETYFRLYHNVDKRGGKASTLLDLFASELSQPAQYSHYHTIFDVKNAAIIQLLKFGPHPKSLRSPEACRVSMKLTLVLLHISNIASVLRHGPRQIVKVAEWKYNTMILINGEVNICQLTNNLLFNGTVQIYLF
eukprot:g35693.t1